VVNFVNIRELNLDKFNEWNLIIGDDHLTSEWFEEEVSDDESSDGSEISDIIDAQKLDELPLTSKYEDYSQSAKNEIIIPESLPGEALNAYFLRTQIEWQQFALLESDRTGKQLRRDAFEFAKDLYDLKFEANEMLRVHLEDIEAELVKRKEKDVNDKNNSRYKTR
jgi:hypothetical protein